ncbi:MAG TPA: hypothetical protein VK162_02215, partial [Streptosporangiaceae bacterium]|nr:hypothetical protein [Streptosporangiaceae bacterium]
MRMAGAIWRASAAAAIAGGGVIRSAGDALVADATALARALHAARTTVAVRWFQGRGAVGSPDLARLAS